MPTPTKHGNYNRKGVSKKAGDGLATVLKRRLASAKASRGGPDYRNKARGAGGDSLVTTLNKAERLPTLTAKPYGFNRNLPTAAGEQPCRPSLSRMVGGPVNPDWLDWYMGFPIGWSALQPLGKRRFQQWLQQHGIYSEE